MRWVREDARDSCALDRNDGVRLVGGARGNGMGETLTAAGPAPRRMARPDGAIGGGIFRSWDSTLR